MDAAYAPTDPRRHHTHSYTLSYQVGLDTGTCRIQVYTASAAVIVMLCVALPTNHGPMITQAADVIVPQVWVREGRPAHLTWIEHYPAAVMPRGELFALRHHTSDGVPVPMTRQPMTRAEVETLLGQAVVVDLR